MSGCGVAGNRRSFDDIRVETIVAERAGVLGLAREKGRQAAALVGRTLTADELTLVQRTLRVFADEIATGLHRDGSDPTGVRAAMRVVVRDGAS